MKTPILSTLVIAALAVPTQAQFVGGTPNGGATVSQGNSGPPFNFSGFSNRSFHGADAQPGGGQLQRAPMRHVLPAHAARSAGAAQLALAQRARARAGTARRDVGHQMPACHAEASGVGGLAARWSRPGRRHGHGSGGGVLCVVPSTRQCGFRPVRMHGQQRFERLYDVRRREVCPIRCHGASVNSVSTDEAVGSLLHL